MTDVRSQKTEDRSQKTEDRSQKTEDRSQKTEAFEVGIRNSEDRKKLNIEHPTSNVEWEKIKKQKN
jgi:hypothetical protein